MFTQQMVPITIIDYQRFKRPGALTLNMLVHGYTLKVYLKFRR